jgi:hypothetical protein
MYWNNPVREFNWPCDHDPVLESLHKGQHCIFYNPAVDKNSVYTSQRLQDLCNWANNSIVAQRQHDFVQDVGNHYDIANLVKLNLWVHDLPINGSIKPMLLHYTGNAQYQSGTGESRLRALERIPKIQTVTAFISTHVRHQLQFAHLESVTTFARFAEICQAEVGQQFLFRTTDPAAPYGLDWYEYNSRLTAQVTPGTDFCVEVMTNYLKQHPGLIFDPAWFDQVIDWHCYKNS